MKNSRKDKLLKQRAKREEIINTAKRHKITEEKGKRIWHQENKQEKTAVC